MMPISRRIAAAGPTDLGDRILLRVRAWSASPPTRGAPWAAMVPVGVRPPRLLGALPAGLMPGPP